MIDKANNVNVDNGADYNERGSNCLNFTEVILLKGSERVQKFKNGYFII